MSNDEVKVDDIEDTSDEIADIEDTDTTDWKAEALKAQALARQNAGIAKRNATRLQKLKEAANAPKQESTPQIKSGFDYAEMAYLEAKGISDEDYPIVLEAMKATGKSLRDTVTSKYVQAELKDAKEARTVKDAVPSGSKRSGNAPRDTVDYWIAKGELPPRDQGKLRTEVLKARIEAERSKSVFTDQSVV